MQKRWQHEQVIKLVAQPGGELSTCPHALAFGAFGKVIVISESNMVARSLLSTLLVATVAAHGDHDEQEIIAGPHQGLWYNTLPGDGGTQANSVFSGISTFGRLPYAPCLSHKDINYDIAFIGLCLSLDSQLNCGTSD